MRFKVEAYDIEDNFDGPRLFKLTLREAVDGEIDVNIVADHDEVLSMLLRPRKNTAPPVEA